MTRPTNPTLHETSSERLFAAATMIQKYPWLLDMTRWTADPNATPADVRGKGVTSPNEGMHLAAIGVALTSPSVELRDGWCEAGADAFGLDDDLAMAIFDAAYAPHSMHVVLRLLADLPEPRTLRAALDAGLRDLAGANLTGVNLTGMDFTAATIPGVFLSVAVMRGTGFRMANLADGDLRECDARGADFRAANLRGVDFRGADVRGADFRLADLSGADFRGAKTAGADLEGAERRPSDPAIPGWSPAGSMLRSTERADR